MDRVFLDSSILYVAGRRAGAAVHRLWNLTGVQLLTSIKTVDEAMRNLETREMQHALDVLLKNRIDVRPEPAPGSMRMVARELYDIDAPVVVAAVAARASHLITADYRRFGKWFGKSIGGVTVVKVGSYLC